MRDMHAVWRGHERQRNECQRQTNIIIYLISIPSRVPSYPRFLHRHSRLRGHKIMFVLDSDANDVLVLDYVYFLWRLFGSHLTLTKTQKFYPAIL